MIDYSATIKKQFNVTGSDNPALLLIEIAHPDLSLPVRFVNDLQDITVQGDYFAPGAFKIEPPDDLSQGEPRAQITVDNVGRELMTWLEASGGGDGATVRLIQVLRSEPNTIEWDITMELYNVAADAFKVTGTLKFAGNFTLPGVALTYRPDTAPGVF